MERALFRICLMELILCKEIFKVELMSSLCHLATADSFLQATGVSLLWGKKAVNSSKIVTALLEEFICYLLFVLIFHDNFFLMVMKNLVRLFEKATHWMMHFYTLQF